jgi:hypothetical protein
MAILLAAIKEGVAIGAILLRGIELTFAMNRPSRGGSSIARCACAVSPSWRRWS